MIHIRPFRRDDLLEIETHERYGDLARCAYAALEKVEPDFYEISWTAVEHISPAPWKPGHVDETILACAGIRLGLAWAFLSPKMTARQAVRVSFRVRKVLKQHSLGRGPVIARIDPDFNLAIRWAKLLGFAHVEGTEKWVYDAQL